MSDRAEDAGEWKEELGWADGVFGGSGGADGGVW